MLRTRIIALILLVIGIGTGYFVVHSERPDAQRPFQLGLDLSGGSSLVYRADVDDVPQEDVRASLSALREVIERRISKSGASEPHVQIETSTLAGEGREHRLIVELPGVTDIDEAIAEIGKTPSLVFKTERPLEETEEILADLEAYIVALANDPTTEPVGRALEDPYFVDTELTGRNLVRARLNIIGGVAGQGVSGAAEISLEFDKEGAEIFKKITEENIGKRVAIYLDNEMINDPVVQAIIPDGQAVITGLSGLEQAREDVKNLNLGALPVPIELISTNTVGPTLGIDAVTAGVRAGWMGLLLMIGFLILWYRLPGLIAGIAMGMYGVVVLALFKLIPITLTTAGIAGFIISLGIAVDANILIFERLKEELGNGRQIRDALREGFRRAWPSIRDANISSIISAIVLYLTGTSLIQGFALTFGIGVLVSMLTAIFVTRIFLFSITPAVPRPGLRWLYQSGFTFSRYRRPKNNPQSHQ